MLCFDAHFEEISFIRLKVHSCIVIFEIPSHIRKITGQALPGQGGPRQQVAYFKHTNMIYKPPGN